VLLGMFSDNIWNNVLTIKCMGSSVILLFRWFFSTRLSKLRGINGPMGNCGKLLT
jgi:hypothetical protein